MGDDREDLALSALDYAERRMDVEEGSRLESALASWMCRVGGK